MPLMFEEEKGIPDNRQRANFIFFAYPYTPALSRDDYRNVVKDLEAELGLRLWYFLDEVTTAELMRKIWRAILRCDMAVFDVSNGNPNVAFELGLAVATNRPSITLLKSGEANPLGSADLGYAERAEYTSVATLKEKLRSILVSKSKMYKTIKDVSYHIYNSSIPMTHTDIQSKILDVIKYVYKNKSINKTQAEKLFGDRTMADAAVYRLREIGVFEMVNQKKAARYVFSSEWVYHDHEVVGV